MMLELLPPNESERQHPCDRCGTLTDEDELQVPPHLGDEGDEFWCAECIHSYEPDRGFDTSAEDPRDPEEDDEE